MTSCCFLPRREDIFCKSATAALSFPITIVKGVRTMDDSRIVELFYARDQQALKESADKYGERLRRLALSFLGSEQDAEECVDDALLGAWRSIPPQKPAELFGYLARLTRCRAFDMLDARNAQKRSAQLVELSAELSECIPDRSADIEESELTEIINGFLEGLPADKRRVFVLRYHFGLSMAEVSKRTDFSESKIKSMLSRLRKQLKDCLRKKGVKL